jgi:Co/Zn/Cd efflux system component
VSRATGSGQHEDHHDHDHGHDHGGANGHGSSWRSRARHTLAHLLSPHSHDAEDKVDSAMEASREGIRTLWISLAVLAATALLQALVVALSGSVALLGDTIHNGADALTALPLGWEWATRRSAC